MKILYVYKDYYPVVGGIENHLRLLAEGLAASGASVTVLVTNTARRTVTEHRSGVHILKAARLLTISSAPVSADLIRLMSKQLPDIVHLHCPYPVGELAYLLAGGTRRMVVTYHSDIVRQKNLLRIYRPFLVALLARADAISVSNPTYLQNSPFVAPHAGKVTVIHHGLDLARCAPTPQSQARAMQIRASYRTPLVLFVGRLRYYKGIEYLLLAMEHVNAHALIVGTGPMEVRWKAAARSLRHGERVTFVGAVSDADLPAYYQAASVFVLPSSLPSETWGAVQVEAMASGLPCVCTELGTGTSYVNQHDITGLVVPPRDSLALATAINRLLEDEALRRKMGQAAQSRAAREFSHTAMIERTFELYQRVLAG